jgi:serine/threonine-protein kinase
MTSPERWRRVNELFQQAIDREPGGREAFLTKACAGDPALLDEVRSLLAAEQKAAGFLDGQATLPAPEPALRPGSRLGVYEIRGLIGSGGMGEVYRAHDARLVRDVAIKVLPSAVAADPGRLARFEREAQVLASLNHPNIASLYGLEEQDGTRGLVMELVDGSTLAEHLRASGAVPIAEALGIAKQIAEALEYAHERGIVHRDLKPANVKLSAEGVIKVLDFGLAKALEAAPSGGELSNSPTLTVPSTGAGVVLGTAAYMSPEQAQGKRVDRRADIWAFGVVLYEMLSGRRAFGGETLSDTLAAVLLAAPKWEALPPGASPAIRRLLTRCLEKDLRRRLQAIGEARLAIEEEQAGGGSGEVPAVAPPAPGRRRLPWALLGVVLGAALAGVLFSMPAPAPALAPVVRFSVPAGTEPQDVLEVSGGGALALSPDGRHLVYAAYHEQTTRLYQRPLDQLEALAVPGTEGADAPFFSPDGRSVGFFAGDKLKKVPLSGGLPRVICESPGGRGGTWGPDDTIIFAPESQSSLFRVPADGGQPEPLTTLDPARGERSHRWPEFLPGGKAVVFTNWFSGPGGFDRAGISVLELATGRRRDLIKGGASYARYAASGHLVYASRRRLFAVPFDVVTLSLKGARTAVVEGVFTHMDAGAAQYAISAAGTLAYASGSFMSDARRLVWVDRKGAVRPVSETRRAYWDVALSPDGSRIATTALEDSAAVWIHDIDRDTDTLLTSDRPGWGPVWTPDGSAVVFTSGADLYRVRADGSSPPELVLASPFEKVAESFTPDGRRLVYGEFDREARYNLRILTLADGRTEPLGSPAHGGCVRVSPDGRWVAYEAAEAGWSEIYVRPFGSGEGRWLVSAGSGGQPVWTREGREIFYRNRRDGTLMTADITPGPPLRVGKPRVVLAGVSFVQGPRGSQDATPDGERFLLIEEGPRPPVQQLQVVLNWLEELRRTRP